MCECYQIGGPFIAEDPDCPVHGVEAQAAEREQEEREARDGRRARALIAQADSMIDVVRLRELMRDLAKMVPGYTR